MSHAENRVACPYCGRTTDQPGYCPSCQQYFRNEPAPFNADPASYGARPPITYPLNAPSGIGGWLILPAIGLILSPLMMVLTIQQNLSLLNQTEAIQRVYPGLHAAIVGETLITAALLGFSIYVAVIFFKTKRELPKMITILLIANLVLMAIDAFWVSSIIGKATGVREVVRAVIAACVWIPYFNSSQRVKATFVN
jgi:hypothetical protein